MEVRAAVYHSEDVPEELYHEALTRLPNESQTRIRRFYRREDACRTLIGELLIRLVVSEREGSQSAIFARTTEGKPYLLNQSPQEQIGFNITHDNALIGLAFSPGVHNPPAFSIGIDMMKVRAPIGETFASFVETFEDQLTHLEMKQVTAEGVSEEEKTRRFFWMWTLKEAYTKALGLGLGFDFKRVEFDVAQREVRINGIAPRGWCFTIFTIDDGEALYQGAVAEYTGGPTQLIDATNQHDLPWLKVVNAGHILRKAVEVLPIL
ncbi:4'-phosphopantetheinyl transferase superfamily [Coprinopsis sp. MPI-PUGE-AT-0042]|nr:4'-phosphopantetheinyl transferase superfamily [Coprinopsis sp. MPI-PUGE-AT-0042]